MKIFTNLSFALILLALAAAPSWAQQSPPAESANILDHGLLATTLADHESSVDQQRARLAGLLARDDVRETAADRGIEMERVEAAAAGLSDAQVEAVSPLVESIQSSSNGGLGTVTIGVGLLIVILLVLILVD